MRTEKEMIDLIMDYANNNDNVKVVAMNGSRVNQKIKKDIFQDYDIVYLVENFSEFVKDLSFVDYFGDRLIMQTPDIMDNEDYIANKRIAFLMQFSDGNRIDLTIRDISDIENYIKEDSLTKFLLDKSNYVKQIVNPTDKDYLIKKPNKTEFFNSCNEFWWVSPYVAKGLWREEILYANYHIDRCLRKELLKMLEWKIGIQNNFNVCVGKCDKYIKNYLSEEDFNNLMKTYSLENYDKSWNALFTLCDLFEKTAKYVALNLGFFYNQEEAYKVKEFLVHIKNLSKNADRIY